MQVVQVLPSRSPDCRATTGAAGCVPQLQFINKVVYVPCRGAELPIPMVQPLWWTIEIPQSLFDKVDDVPGVQVVLDSWCRREGDSRDLTAVAVEKIVVSRWSWQLSVVALG